MKRTALLFSIVTLCACSAPEHTTDTTAPPSTATTGSTASTGSTPEHTPASPESASSGSTATDCIGENGALVDLDEGSCCEGLAWFPNDPIEPSEGTCPAPDPGPHAGTCVRTCGDGTCVAPETFCSCNRDCPRP
ncbi:MAG: hypothetical protein AB8H86_04365 [Polyangiales bacterium]